MAPDFKEFTTQQGRLMLIFFKKREYEYNKSMYSNGYKLFFLRQTEKDLRRCHKKKKKVKSEARKMNLGQTML